MASRRSGGVICLYTWALRLLPRDFRERFGDALLDEAVTSFSEARGVWGRIRIGVMLATDLLGSCAREWKDVLIASDPDKGRATEMPWAEQLGRNLRFAARSSARNPVFSLTAVLLMALGVGAVTSVFTLVDQVLLRPLAYPEQHRLAYLRNGSFNRPTVQALDDVAAFDAWTATYPKSANVLLGGREPTLVRSVDVTPSFFTIFGARPALGRLLVEDDYADGSVAVLTHAAWETMWGADPALIGSTIYVDSEPVTIVGVLSEDFDVPEGMLSRRTQLFRPVDWTDPALGADTRVFSVVVRLAAGVDSASAQAQLDGLAAGLMQRGLLAYTRQTPSWPVVPLKDATTLRARSGLLLLLAAVSLLLLIACANVALLFLTRGLARSRELAVRRALGAGARTLLGQLLTESLLLGTVAGLLAVGLAHVALAGFTRWVVALPRAGAIALDVRAFALALGLGVLAAVCFGLLPAIAASRGDVSSRLHQSGRSSTEGRRLGGMRSALVVGEVATSLVLVSLAGLLLRSFLELTAQDPGVDPGHVWMIPVRPLGSEEPAEYRGRMDRVRDALSAVSGVESVSWGREMPFQFVGGDECCEFSGIVQMEGSDVNLLEAGRILPRHYVTASFFETLGVRLIAGSVWNPTEVGADPAPAVVSERLAIEAFGGADAAVGRVLVHGGDPLVAVRVSGVAQPTLHYGLDQSHDVALYAPIETLADHEATTFAVRLSGPAGSDLGANLRRAIWAVEPTLPVPTIEPLSAWIDGSLGRRRFSSDLASVFGVVALVLAGAGLYGTLLYAVDQRRRELGIRMALGAASARIQAGIVLWGLSLGSAGVAIGIPLALYLGRFVQSRLWGVSPTDPTTFVVGSVVLLGAAALASWMPSYRAARTDPLEVLKAE